MATFFRTQAAPQCHYTQIGPTRIYSEVLGSGPPLVLLHGLGGSTRWWGRNKLALAKHHEVHMIDMAGFGRSNGSFVLAEAAQQLAEWSQLRGLGRVNLIGHSLGGYIAACIAANNPQLIDHLILVGAALSSPDLPRSDAKFQGPPVPLSMMPLALCDVARAGFGVMARVAYELIRSDVRETLSRVRARTLLVWGERDGAVPLSVGRAALKQIPEARLAVICNAGHTPMWEQPLAFNHTVLAFLAGQPIRSQVP
jgi:pimeloyl-ACP methyl ester carboxylesterase